MYRAFHVFVTIFFLLVAFSEAASRGVYGKLEYLMMNDGIKDSYNKTSRVSFVQNYQFGYEKFLYSPRLLTYDLGFSLYIDNSTSNITNNGTTTKSETETKHTNYKAYLNFLKKSNYPFTVYYERIDSPIWSIYEDSTSLITYKTDKSGLFGRVKSESTNYNYEIRWSQTDKLESFANEARENMRVALGLDKQFDENRTFSFTYSHEKRDYQRVDTGLNYNDNWSDSVDIVNSTYSWILSKTTQLLAYVNYLSNDTLEYEDLTGNLSLRWRPSRKRSETLTIMANNSNTKSGTNNFYSITENGSFQHTDNFSTNHSFQAYFATGDLYNMTLLSATLGATYIKHFSESFSGTLGASVTGRNETFDYGDQNSSIKDRNAISYTISSSLSKSFQESNSNIYSGITFYQLLTTTDERTDRVNINAGYDKKFSKKVSYYLKGYVTYDNNRYISSENNVTERITEIFNAETYLSYEDEVGYRGKLNLKAGVLYSVGTYADRVNPYGTLSFVYMLRRDLLFKTLAKVSSDTAYDIISYTGNSNLVYRLRKLEFKTGIQWSRQTGGSIIDREHINYYFRISRKF